MPLLNDLKSEFSLAYARAIAHAAGYFAQGAERLMDADGVDLTIFARGGGGVVRSPRLDLQVKATAANLEGDPFEFKLEVKNYNELRSAEFQVPRILLIVSVPAELDNWVDADETRLLMRHCGYWKSLHGAPPPNNETKEPIFVARTSLFHVDQLKAIMQRVADGQLP